MALLVFLLFACLAVPTAPNPLHHLSSYRHPGLLTYTGTLRQLNTNALIAHVAGLEKVLPVANDTFAAHKAFFYHNSTTMAPLTSYKRTPTSPARQIPLPTSLAVYTTSTTLHSARSLASTTVYPSNATTFGTLTLPPNQPPNTLTFTVHSRRSFTGTLPPEEQPKRKLLQFGKSTPASQYTQTETFKYTKKGGRGKGTVSYRRIGECPSWHGPGMCLMELEGEYGEEAGEVAAVVEGLVENWGEQEARIKGGEVKKRRWAGRLMKRVQEVSEFVE